MNRVAYSILLVSIVLLVIAVPIVYDQHRTVRVIHNINVLRIENRGHYRGEDRGYDRVNHRLDDKGRSENRHHEKQTSNMGLTNAVHNHIKRDHRAMF